MNFHTHVRYISVTKSAKTSWQNSLQHDQIVYHELKCIELLKSDILGFKIIKELIELVANQE